MTRMMKFNSVFFFSAAALLSLIVACSNGEDTAGVISETESGKTIAGIITNNEGKPLARARVYIVGVDTASYHTYAMDSTETDEDGHYSIYTSGDQGFYRVYAKAASSSETLIGYEEYDGYSDSILNNRTLDSLQFDITVDVPGSLQMFLQPFWKNVDSLCFHGTFVCASKTKEDEERGYMIVDNMPNGTFLRFTTWEKGTASSSAPMDNHKIYAGKTTFWGPGAGGPAVDSFEVAIPDKALAILDSAKLSPILNNLIVPVFKKDSSDALMDAQGTDYFLHSAQNENDSNRYWVALDSIGAEKQTMRWISADVQGRPQSKIPHLYASIGADTPLSSYNYADSSIAVSFWIKQEGDSAKPVNIFTAGSDTLGFKIIQCEKDAQFICTTIHSGIDTDSSDSDIYGKAKVLDGERHHVSLVIHKKHLTIAIDGETIRDTDLKLSEKFFSDVLNMSTGDVTLEDFIAYSFYDSIRKDGEKDWTRLQAWLMAFYELQKQ